MNIKIVAEKTFNILKGFGFEVSSYNKKGDLVIDPMEATRFAVESPNILVRIDPLDKHLSLKTGTPGESIEKIRPMLKELAHDYLLDFDYSVFDKQIKPKGEKLDVAKVENKEVDLMSEELNILRKLAGVEEGMDSTASSLGQEAQEKGLADKFYNEMKEKGMTQQANDFMNKFKQLGSVDQALEAVGYFQSFEEKQESSDSITEASLGKMTGSRKSSYQPLADNVKIIVRHNKDVNEEVRGARSRNIHSILIQRGEEKFKMAENNLSAARAMARHLHNGGETFDEIGEAITEMSREFKKLKEFVNYVRRSNLVNEKNEEFVTLAMENINNIKSTFKSLSGVTSYANAVESVKDYNNVELLQDDLDLESKFTETHFDDKVANAMESLKAMTSRKRSFESKITKAIELESFAGLKNIIAEDNLLEFETLHQQLGHRVGALSNTAKDPVLGKYLHGISNKLNSGGQLNQFEYGAIKSCLLSAGQNNTQVQGAPMNFEESYEAFMDRFDI